MRDETIHGLDCFNNEIHDCNIVVNHKCNKHCKTCIDKFLDVSKDEVTLEMVEKYISRLTKYTTQKCKEIMLLGGEPTCSSFELLKGISDIGRHYGWRMIMSTNGIEREKILRLRDCYDVFQITMRGQSDIDFWKSVNMQDKITAKFNGDADFTLDTLNWFIENTREFYHKSINMFHTQDGQQQLCTDKRVWDLILPLERTSHLMYHVVFYKGVRIKWGSPGCTQVEKCPSSPILFPNGNYGCTWQNENLDDYLKLNWLQKQLIRQRD